MPNAATSTARHVREAAIRNVDDLARQVLGGASLSRAELSGRWGEKFDVGWRVPIVASDGVRRELDILADEEFPYGPTRVALVEPPPTLAWAHVEADGLLCLHRTDLEVPSDNAPGVVKYLLGQARKLIELNIRGQASTDFRDEFLSYWRIAAKRDGGQQMFVSLVEPRGPGRTVVIWRGANLAVAAETSETLRRWLERYGPTRRISRFTGFRNCALLWLPEPLVPAQYPETAADVRSLVGQVQSSSTSHLADFVSSKPDVIDVLLGMRGKNGPCFASVTVDRPSRKRRLRKKGDPLVDGFRPNRVPPKVLVDRYFSPKTRARKASVQRADHAWVHGRDQDPTQERLRYKRVAIVGCGSLGGPIARLLAQSGVGNLLLIDCDLMDWPNISRHVLGAPSVDKSKADSLSASIRESYPHLGEIASKHKRLDGGQSQLIEEMRECDLVLDTTGNWAASNLMNDLHLDGPRFPARVFAWMESRASACHAVVIEGISSCLRCGFASDGNPHLAVTEWSAGSSRAQGPDCADAFSPYGAVELAWAHSLVLETVISALLGNVGGKNHWAWIGSRSRIEAAGGRWSDEWVANVGDPGEGHVKVRREWTSSDDCPACKTRGDTLAA